MTLWQGRLADQMADVVSEFTVSLKFDWALAHDDLQGSRSTCVVSAAPAS